MLRFPLCAHLSCKCSSANASNRFLSARIFATIAVTDAAFFERPGCCVVAEVRNDVFQPRPGSISCLCMQVLCSKCKRFRVFRLQAVPQQIFFEKSCNGCHPPGLEASLQPCLLLICGKFVASYTTGDTRHRRAPCASTPAVCLTKNNLACAAQPRQTAQHRYRAPIIAKHCVPAEHGSSQTDEPEPWAERPVCQCSTRLG